MDNVMDQVNMLVNDRITTTLQNHDAIISDLDSQMESMVSELGQLQLIYEAAALEREREQIENQKMNEKALKAIADKQDTLKLRAQQQNQKKEESSPIQPRRKPKAATTLPPAIPTRRSNNKDGFSNVDDKPRGRIVGKVVDSTIGGLAIPLKVKNTKTTEFLNVPRCADVGKGGTDIERQREEQASAQVKYSQCRSAVYIPTNDMEGENKKLWQAKTQGDRDKDKIPPVPPPDSRLEMDFVYGYHNSGMSPSGKTNTFYLGSGEIVYPTAAVIVVYDVDEHVQAFFNGHNQEVSALAIHPDGVTVASSQSGRAPPVFVWDSSKRKKGSKVLPDECRQAALLGHDYGVTSLDFSHDGKLLVSVGSDRNNMAIVWDWANSTQLAAASCGGQNVFDMRFNPYQAYAIPDATPQPGQAPNINDAVYTLTSCGIRHIKFWVFLRSERSSEGDADGKDSGMGDPKQWYLEGNSVNYATKTNVQDITCFTFVDDSSEITCLDPATGELEAFRGSSERTDSRIVAGTADGDFFVFKQPPVNLRYGADDSSTPKPWWLTKEGSRGANDGTARYVLKRLWDSHAKLIGIVPHSVEAGTKYTGNKKDKDEIDRLNAKLRLQPSSLDLRSKLSALQYKGPTGYNGSATVLRFNNQLKLIVSSGKDGRIRVWNPQCGSKEKDWAYSNSGGMSEVGSVEIQLGDDVQPGAVGRSIDWNENGDKLVVGTNNNSLLTVAFNKESSKLGHVKEIVSSHYFSLSGVAMHPSKPLFVTVGRDKCVNLWLGDSNTCAAQLKLTAQATSVAFHANGDVVVVGLTTFEFVVLEVVEDGPFTYTLRKCFQKSVAPKQEEETDVVAEKGKDDVPSVGRKARGSPRVLNTEDPLLLNLNAHDKKQAASKGSSSKEVMDIKYSPSGSHLAIAVKDNCIYIYSLTDYEYSQEDSYRLIAAMKGHTSMVTNIDWSSDGKFLQSNSSDSELLYWEITSTDASISNFRPCQFARPFLLRDCEWHSWSSIYGWPVRGIWPTDIETILPVRGVMRSHHGEVVLICDDAARIRLSSWPCLPGDGKREYFGHAISSLKAKFSHDDSTVVSIGGQDCTIIQWCHLDGAGARVKYDSSITPRRPTAVRLPRSFHSQMSPKSSNRRIGSPSASQPGSPTSDDARSFIAGPSRSRRTTRERNDFGTLPEDGDVFARIQQENRMRKINQHKRVSENMARAKSGKARSFQVEVAEAELEDERERENGNNRRPMSIKTFSKDKSRTYRAPAATVEAAVEPISPSPSSPEVVAPIAAFPRQVIALFDYFEEDAEEGAEPVAFAKGDILTVFNLDDGWYSGKKGELFPANFMNDEALS